MDDALLVGLGQGGGHLPHDRQGLRQLGRAVAGEPLAEVLPLHVFLDDVVQAVDVAHLVDLHDVGVHQRGGGLGLALETLQIGLVAGQLRLEDLDRHPAFQRALLGQVDLGHGPAAQAAEQLQIADLPAGKIGKTVGIGGLRTGVTHRLAAAAGGYRLEATGHWLQVRKRRVFSGPVASSL